MTDSVMLKLGEYKFSLETACYQELTRSTKYRWQENVRINNISALQFLGESNATITLTGASYPYFKGGLKQLDGMRKEATKGKPLLLVDGLGVVHGYWVITSIEERHSTISAQGVPRKINFTLGITCYADKLPNA